MPMHTTGGETSHGGSGPKITRPKLSHIIPPPDSSSVSTNPSHSPHADLFALGDDPHMRTMWSHPSEPPEPPTEHRLAEFDPSCMINGYPSPSGPLLNTSSGSKRKRAMPGWSPVKKAKPVDENQGDETISDTFLDKSRSDPGHSMNIRINNLVKQVTEVLSKSNISDQIRDLSVEEAQCTLDFLQDLLDVPGIPPLSKRTLLQTSLKLTRTHDCVPRCLVLRGFSKTGDRAFAVGHFGELWKGTIEGVKVAVKQARIFTSDNNIRKVLRQVRREAIIWRQCDHPNVLPFYGIFRDSAPSTYCLVSPFLDNGSLRQYMSKTVDPDRHKLIRTD